MKEAFKLILRDENVKAILVNIFGGIVRCDLIAEGVVAAASDLGVEVPLVVRLQGTKADEGREILAESNLNITPAETLKEAGELAVAAAKGAPDMAILCDKNTKLLIQGMGSMGTFHARLSREYGTQVVGGVHPGKGGSEIEGFPSSTPCGSEAATGANASVIFVPPPGAADAILEAAENELDLAVCITEGIPVIDMARAKAALAEARRDCSARTARAS